MNDRIEILILKSLVYTDEFTKRVLPFIKPEYFSEEHERKLYEKIEKFVVDFHSLPTIEALAISINQDTKLSEDLVKRMQTTLTDSITQPDKIDINWLVSETEKWCKDQAIFIALKASVSILDDKTGKKSKGSIPQLLSDALAVTFDTNVGHDYIKGASDRFDNWHDAQEKLPFDLKMFNKITKGGLEKKTLNIILAGTGVGKSLTMCHMAAASIHQGKNVLYITLEMSTEMIAQRIDANLLDITLDDLMALAKTDFLDRVHELTQKNSAYSSHALKIKQYPTATASAMHFRALLDELLMKENFKPDIVFVDYINLATSCRISTGSNTNSYFYIKSIAEELRGLAVEYEVALVSATQTTRGGFTNTDPGLEDTSESFGLPHTADFMIALVTTDDLAQRGQLKVKQLKNRYNDINKCHKFLIGIDRSKMRLFDLDDSAQDDLNKSIDDKDDKPAFDKSKFGKGMKQEKKSGFSHLVFDDDDKF